jgi:hypothetical protein
VDFEDPLPFWEWVLSLLLLVLFVARFPAGRRVAMATKVGAPRHLDVTAPRNI